MQQVDQLIRTKLRLPFTRSGLVPRPRLQEQILRGLRGPLTLITAPAGFGKTTLVASYLVDSGIPRDPSIRVAWLSLDKDDNLEERFLSYLIAALQATDETIGREAAQMMVGRQSPASSVLISLINDLDVLSTETAIVLDDYHFVTNPAVHEHVAFLLEHCPKTFHLVIVTRSDPPLPLSRLRARSQMVEFRAADLRFTLSEAAQFLNEVMGLHLDDKSVEVLAARTEGWIAGLQMAALSMKDRKDVFGFLESFSGTNRYILDYLMGEVLVSQPSEIQRFLLYTSILDRLTAPLCDMVIGGELRPIPEGSAAGGFESWRIAPASQSILEYLERVNLFLVPLDEDRIWYRYHHLFADLLAAQLIRVHPEMIPELHIRASLWYEQNGLSERAIEHAFSAGDLDRAGRLIEDCARKLIYQISFEKMQTWIDRLPEEMTIQRAWLGVSQAWLWVVKMNISPLESWIDQVEQYFEAGGKDRYTVVEKQDIRSNLSSLRAYAAFFKGDLRRCMDLSLKALNLISPANGDLCIRILVQLGETSLALMELEQASAYLAQAINTGIKFGDLQSVSTASMRLYRTFKILGRLNEAEDLLHRVFQALSQAGRADSPVATKLEQCRGDLLRERGQMAEAGIQLDRALEHARQYHSPLDIVTALIYQCMWRISQADLDGAHKALDEAGSMIHSFTIPAIVTASWSRQQARLCLEKDELALVEEYIERDRSREEAGILQSRLLLKKGEYDQAYDLLLPLEQDAAVGKRYGNLIQIWLLQAILLQALDRLPEALDTLIRCLTFAQPQGYLTTFLDEGEPVQQLLTLLRHQPLPQPMAEYTLRLLRAFEQRAEPIPSPSDSVEHQAAMAQEIAAKSVELVEPLSSRELEVLRLMAQGRTNLEIAQELVVALGTVKAHAASIYRKLDVANRTEAVARARQWTILP